jgi:Dolichyl-phosphate-mannose-protein mannosyltransferase
MDEIWGLLRKHEIHLIFLVALFFRLLAYLLIPVDWNSDSYHHWLISYMTLRIGLSHGRLWDLLGCDYYWGMVPHLVQAFLLWGFRTSSIEIIRVFNVLLGSVNAVLVYKIVSVYYRRENALWSGFSFAVFPVAVFFDSIGMQDTLALSLILASLYSMRSNHFWSGVCLGLACHTRIEYTLVSVLILVGFILRERLFTDSQPYILGWLVAWGIPSLHIYIQTGNPVYPLYYSLYSVFGGYTSKFKGLPFFNVMVGWLGARLHIWTQSVYGWMIILLGLLGLFLIPYMAYRKWFRYELQLYWVSALMVMGPLFLPYFDSERIYLLMMIRFIIPIVALGLPLFFHHVSRMRHFTGRTHLATSLQGGVLLLFLSLFSLLLPQYMALQSTVINEFNVADKAGEQYSSGDIVCDVPSMLYRLTVEWDIPAKAILSNHYGPQYYGIDEPGEYLEWLSREDVRLWMYYGERGDSVWRVVDNNYPGVFVNLFGEPRMGCYLVDQGLIDSLL